MQARKGKLAGRPLTVSATPRDNWEEEEGGEEGDRSDIADTALL
jgi:hypothetical protein